MDKISMAQKKFIDKNSRRKKRVLFYRILILISFILLWEGATRVGLVDPFIFSSPFRVSKTFAEMAFQGTIFYHIGITLFETLLSFFLITFLGIIMAVILWTNISISEVLEPYLVILNSVPKSALAPVLIVWLGNNMKTIIFAAVTLGIFSTIINVYTGFQEIDNEKIKLIYTFRGTKRDVLTKVVIPGTIPLIISTMKVNIGLSLIGVIIGEFLAANAGLGYLIIYGSQVFKLDWVILSIIILCVLAGSLYYITNMAEKYIKKRF
ncbi:MAG: ABC transporter permease [Clostridiales bacterium]|nr:ABC transporter permease [Clostridiales bacterium]